MRYRIFFSRGGLDEDFDQGASRRAHRGVRVGLDRGSGAAEASAGDEAVDVGDEWHGDEEEDRNEETDDEETRDQQFDERGEKTRHQTPPDDQTSVDRRPGRERSGVRTTLGCTSRSVERRLTPPCRDAYI